MIWILRNISVHLWIITLFAIPLNFFILPGFIRYFSGISPVIISLIIITGISAVIIFLMDLSARKRIAGLIKEGQIWERSGISKRAEKNYIKALRIYDTFLLWPFSAKNTALKISGSIARFNLNSLDHNLVEENPDFKLSVLIYLKMNPEDKDIAKLWLTRLRSSKIVTSFEQDILSMLAEKYYADKTLSILILDIFLGLEREDYIAKKLYQHVLQIPEFNYRYAAKIESLIGKKDETLKQTVSFQLPGKQSVKQSVTKPAEKQVQKSTIQIANMVNQIAAIGISYLKGIWTFLCSTVSFLILSVKKIYIFIKEHEKTQFYIKACILLVVSAGLLFFLMNTVSHVVKPKPVEKHKIEVPIQAPKPFTIQVAAYLKPEHAQGYVDSLKAKKIDATVKKINGGGKTWFVVRISEFMDKQSAAAYGKKLKKQNIIDDFFVNNK